MFCNNCCQPTTINSPVITTHSNDIIIDHPLLGKTSDLPKIVSARQGLRPSQDSEYCTDHPLLGKTSDLPKIVSTALIIHC